MKGPNHSPPESWEQEREQLIRANAELEDQLARLAVENARLRHKTEQFDKLVVRNAYLEERLTKLEAERQEQSEMLVAMNDEFEALKRQVFGRKSEKIPPLKNEVRKRTGKKPDPAKAAERRRQNKDQKKKKAPKERIDHPVDRGGPECPECGREREDFRPVGEGHKTERWEYVPGYFRLEEHYAEVLSCPCGEHMVTAEGPAQAYDGAQYGPGFISHLLVSRSLDTITFGTLERQFARLEIPIAKATLVGLFHRSANQLGPLAERILELVRQQSVVMADETRMKMQHKDETGKDGTGYFWAFLANNLVGYRFSPTRSGETPRELLEGTSGTLVVDAYSGYNQVTGPKSRKRAGCLAHVRRKFFDALKTAPEAQTAMDFIHDLYVIEHDALEAGIVRKPQHLELRKKESTPIMEKFREWLADQKDRHLPKGAMGKAISYTINNWEALTQFLKSEQTPLDNNQSERALRVIALLRKNSLHVGHDDAGRNMAIVMTLAVTCKANGVNPQEYFADVLIRLQKHPDSRIDELLPHNWKPLDKPNDTS